MGNTPPLWLPEGVGEFPTHLRYRPLAFPLQVSCVCSVPWFVHVKALGLKFGRRQDNRRGNSDRRPHSTIEG